MSAAVPRGLYVLTDAALVPSAQLVERVARAIAGGAAMVQYRDKSADRGRRLWEAQDLQALCRSQRVPLIINDDIELARACDADGVHLGRDDETVAAARAALGEHAIIGVSCYDSLERAQAAQAQGADYVAFGSFFPSPTKPTAVRADIELLRAARAELHIPIAAIGGITADNGATLIAAGADLLAVVHAVFGQNDAENAARRIANLFGAAV